MNYQFPEIYHIDDVLNHIRDYDEIRVSYKEEYSVINYAVAFENTFAWNSDDPIGSAIRRECRGLIFNTDGKLISRPYHKFFNAGEKKETQLDKINLYEPHVILEKLDGSMIRPIPTADGFRLATKAGITDIAEQAEGFIADKSYYSTFINKCIQKGMTPIFEWCSRKNRIVIDYSEDQLILTGIRDNDTGSYVTYEIMKSYASAWSILVVKAFAWNTGGKIDEKIEEVVDHIRKWEDSEGIVLRFDNGHMVKVKADDYVLKHHTKDQINQEKNVILTIINDQVDDMIPLLSVTDADDLKRFQENFWIGIDATVTMLEKIYAEGNIMYTNQKDFAVEFVNKMIPISHRQFMFGMRQEKNVRNMIMDCIQKLNTQAKIDECRWLWGNHKWN